MNTAKSYSTTTIAVIFAASLIVSMIIVACGSTSNSNTAYPSPPLYPNAQNVTVDRSDPELRTVRFQTNDTSQAVLSFYKNELTKQGWEFDSDLPNQQGFHGIYRMRSSSSELKIFAITVEATSTNSLTNVRIDFLFAGPGLAFPEDYHFPSGYD